MVVESSNLAKLVFKTVKIFREKTEEKTPDLNALLFLNQPILKKIMSYRKINNFLLEINF